MPQQASATSLGRRSLVDVRNVSKYYPRARRFTDVIRQREQRLLRAVDDVSFAIVEGETLGLVGESGCGKSTLGRMLVSLVKPSAGEIRFRDRALDPGNRSQMRDMHRRMQIVFQDPYSSLNPRMSIGQALKEILTVHGIDARGKRSEQVEHLLQEVGLPTNFAKRRPDSLSGGQRQRVGIAKALAVKPEFIVADEAVSALDVSMQAQILNLMMHLQHEFHLTYLFISHDLAVVRHVSQRIIVMYYGRLVEESPVNDIFLEPLHPYTQTLLRAIPSLDPKPRGVLSDRVVEGESGPAVIGCNFAPRCPFAMDVCRHETPDLVDVGGGRRVACHLF